MTLRLRIALALTIAALLPMAVAVGVALLRAQRSAEREAESRLGTVRRQATILIDLRKKDLLARAESAAADLARDGSALEALRRAQSGAYVRAIAPRYAQRSGLDWLEIVGADGIVLSGTGSDSGLGHVSAFSEIPAETAVPRALPPDEGGAGRRVLLVMRRAFSPGGEPLGLISGSTLGAGFLETLARVSEGPVALVDAAGAPIDTGGGTAAAVEDEPQTAKPPIDAASGGAMNGAAGTGSEARTPGDASGEMDSDSAAGSRGKDGTGTAEEAPVHAVGPPAGTGDPRRITADVPLGEGGISVRVSVPAADVAGARRELLGVFAGIAPFALVSALVVGAILAESVTRPIRALASRADEISGERAGPFATPPPADEVRRLKASFERMLESLSESERQRVGAERIAAWQEVARRIAHEVKNPLSPIQLAVENLRRTREMAPAGFDRAFDEETATILEEVDSLRRLVDEFSQFARLPSPQLAPCDLTEVIAQTLALHQPRIARDGVRVETSVTEGMPAVIADAEQIGRALKNIVANALDAMEGAAERRLSIALRGRGTPFGEVAEIEVTDTGVGFAPEVMRRVFEPYFTTRAERGGTGLGMAIAYRIAAEHGGTIRVDGAPGRGATVTLAIPIDGPRAPTPAP